MDRFIKSLLISILVIILLNACSEQALTERVSPEAVYTSAAKTAAAYLTVTAISWTTTPSPTLTPLFSPTPTPTPAPYGIQIVLNEEAFCDNCDELPLILPVDALEKNLPIQWKPTAGNPARYQINITTNGTLLKDCLYTGGHHLFRVRIDALVAITDTVNGEILIEKVFTGSDPGVYGYLLFAGRFKIDCILPGRYGSP